MLNSKDSIFTSMCSYSKFCIFSVLLLVWLCVLKQNGHTLNLHNYCHQLNQNLAILNSFCRIFLHTRIYQLKRGLTCSVLSEIVCESYRHLPSNNHYHRPLKNQYTEHLARSHTKQIVQCMKINCKFSGVKKRYSWFYFAGEAQSFKSTILKLR